MHSGYGIICIFLVYGRFIQISNRGINFLKKIRLIRLLLFDIHLIWILLVYFITVLLAYNVGWNGFFKMIDEFVT